MEAEVAVVVTEVDLRGVEGKKTTSSEKEKIRFSCRSVGRLT